MNTNFSSEQTEQLANEQQAITMWGCHHCSRCNDYGSHEGQQFQNSSCTGSANMNDCDTNTKGSGFSVGENVATCTGNETGMNSQLQYIPFISFLLLGALLSRNHCMLITHTGKYKKTHSIIPGICRLKL
jgi:hypothetical protein